MIEAEFYIVLCTCPDQEVAEGLATACIEARLAGCVNIIPGLTSIYQWKGEVRKGTEVLMILKTPSHRLKALEEKMVADHPYEFPEFIATPLVKGNQPYLQWLMEVTD